MDEKTKKSLKKPSPFAKHNAKPVAQGTTQSSLRAQARNQSDGSRKPLTLQSQPVASEYFTTKVMPSIGPSTTTGRTTKLQPTSNEANADSEDDDLLAREENELAQVQFVAEIPNITVTKTNFSKTVISTSNKNSRQLFQKNSASASNAQTSPSVSQRKGMTTYQTQSNYNATGGSGLGKTPATNSQYSGKQNLNPPTNPYPSMTSSGKKVASLLTSSPNKHSASYASSMQQLAAFGKREQPPIQPMILGQTMLLGAKKHQNHPVRANNNMAAKLKMAKTGAAALFSQNSSTKECTFCSPSLAHQHSSCLMNSNSSMVGKGTNNLMNTTGKRVVPPSKALIMTNLGRKYGNCQEEFENLKVVNDLIYNEQTHIVSIFKDYLILDDINEFLKRFYHGVTESAVRLPKLCEFYHKYSQVFPNFVTLPESKYMFRNIQRKQRLIDEQFNNKNPDGANNNGSLTGHKNGPESRKGESRRQQSLLLTSSNKLFTTGFIESVINQKSCTDYGLEEEWVTKRLEGQEKRYLESAKRLDKTNRDRTDTSSMIPFKAENLDALVQKFLNKDTESTIRLNSSLGHFGDELLGDTFRQEMPSQRLSVVTQDQDSLRGEIGLITRKSDQVIADELIVSLRQAGGSNRMSMISSKTCSFQQPPVKTGASTVTGKTGPAPTKGHQLKASFKRQNKAGSSGVSQRKSGMLRTNNVNGAGSTLGVQLQASNQNTLQKSATVVGTIKQKVNQMAASQSNLQQQLSNKQLASQHHSKLNGRNGVNQKSSKSSIPETDFNRVAVDEQKFLRNNYLECDLIDKNQQLSSERKHRGSANIESNSQSPVEGILNPLSSQPLLSKTSLNQKTTQPGSSLGFFKQRSSEIAIGSATPTQHLYHSKKSSMKQTKVPSGEKNALPQLNLIQQQVESDYYSSGLLTNKGQFVRSQTAMNSVHSSARPTMLPGKHSKQSQLQATTTMQTKHVSRERSPPLMQSTKQNQAKKGKMKSPHQKKDRRTAVPQIDLGSSATSQYMTGKSSTSSIKQRVASAQRGKVRSGQLQAEAKGVIQNVATFPAKPLCKVDFASKHPLSTQSSHGPLQLGKQQKFYSQTEINEAEEDYPDEEVADEIPDQDDTEDELEHCVSEDEARLDDSKEASQLAHDKLRPVDMLPTHGGAFAEEEDCYKMKLPVKSTRPRAKTTLTSHQPTTNLSKRSLSRQNPAKPSFLHNQGLEERERKAWASSVCNAESETVRLGQEKPSAFNSTQQPGQGQGRLGLQTELDVRRLLDPSLTLGQISLGNKLPVSTSHAANRPNTNLVDPHSITVKSKFSRENSVSSRHDTHPPLPLAVKPYTVQDNQKFFEASMKLGSKALINTQGILGSAQACSLRSSLEPNQLVSKVRQKPPQTVTTSNHGSMNGSLRPQKAANSISKSKKSQQLQYKVDLTTRLASNLINEHSKRKTDTGRMSSNKHQQSKTPLSSLPLQSPSFVQTKQTGSSQLKPGNYSLKGEAVKQRANTRVGVGLAATSSSWKRKTVTSQSPQASSSQQQAKKVSNETLGFKAMGSGKASYLTNVGMAATANTLSGTSSRNYMSPYASQNQYQRFIPKDGSTSSLPHSKVLSRSPPQNSKDSLLMQSRTALTKTQNQQNLTLQQQLQTINKQLAMSQVKTSSFRQAAAISPSQQSNQSKKQIGGVSVQSPQMLNSNPSTSLASTNEKNTLSHQQRTSLDRQGLAELASTHLTPTLAQQRSSLAQNCKSSSFTQPHQALISLPGAKSQQKNLHQQMQRVSGAKSGLSKPSTALGGESKVTSKGKGGPQQFLGQPRYFNASKGQATALSPQPQSLSKHSQAKTKKNGVGSEAILATSDRSVKSLRGVNLVGSVQVNIFQQSTGDLRQMNSPSIEEVSQKTSANHNRAMQKKQSNSKSLKKQSNQRHLGSTNAMSLSPPAHSKKSVKQSLV